MKIIEEQYIKLTQNENNPEEIRKLIGTSEDLYLECKTVAEDEIRNNSRRKWYLVIGELQFPICWIEW